MAREELRALDGIDDEDRPASIFQIRRVSAQVDGRISRHLEGRFNSTEFPLETPPEDDPLGARRDAAEAKRRLLALMGNISR